MNITIHTWSGFLDTIAMPHIYHAGLSMQ